MNRIDIINNLIKKNSYISYLEIGVATGHCFRAVEAPVKIGVDPDPASAATLHMTSDEFFAQCDKESRFDIILLDGLHHADQAESDIENSLRFLSEGGTIVVHDCLPTNKHMQEIPRTDQNEWTGNTWKAFARLRAARNDLQMRVVDTDWGCGIIRRGEQDYVSNIDVGNLDYSYFAENRKEVMNVISVAEYRQKYLDLTIQEQ